MQLGPTILSRCGWAARRMRLRQRLLSSCAAAPSPGPAVMITATLVPRSPSSTTRRGTVSAGVMITARSAGCGSSSRLFSTGRPSMSPPLMLPRWMSPWKPPASRLRVTAAPTEPGRALAPIATTDRGTIILSRLRVDMALEPHPHIAVVLSAAKDLIAACHGHEILRCAQDDISSTHRARHPELVVVGQRLERGEVRLELRLIGQAAIGDHIEAAAGPQRASGGGDDALA